MAPFFFATRKTQYLNSEWMTNETCYANSNLKLRRHTLDSHSDTTHFPPSNTNKVPLLSIPLPPLCTTGIITMYDVYINAIWHQITHVISIPRHIDGLITNQTLTQTRVKNKGALPPPHLTIWNKNYNYSLFGILCLLGSQLSQFLFGDGDQLSDIKVLNHTVPSGFCIKEVAFLFKRIAQQ